MATDLDRLLNKSDLVEEFHEAFELTGKDSVELRTSLILEEVEEVREAFQHLLKEMADLQYVIVGGIIEGTEEDLGIEVQEAIARVANVFQFIPQGLIDEVFLRVHESNMSKLGEDGKPIYREDGKVLKGENYKEPYLGDLI